jgi:predicted DNA-binding protein
MATKGKQIITNVYLEPDVYAALKELSEATGAPMAHYIRKGIDKVLAEAGWPGFDPPQMPVRKSRKAK